MYDTKTHKQIRFARPSVWLKNNLHFRLKKLAAAEGRTLVGLIERAVTTYLEAKEK